MTNTKSPIVDAAIAMYEANKYPTKWKNSSDLNKTYWVELAIIASEEFIKAGWSLPK